MKTNFVLQNTYTTETDVVIEKKTTVEELWEILSGLAQSYGYVLSEITNIYVLPEREEKVEVSYKMWKTDFVYESDLTTKLKEEEEKRLLNHFDLEDTLVEVSTRCTFDTD